MKINFAALLFILGFLICVGNSFAEDNETSTDSNISESLEKLNITRTNDSNTTRRLLSAVPGVDGRIIGQDVPSVVATTEPPITLPAATTPPPEPEEKAACGPTLLIALALIPLALKRKCH
jgi:hypothetical protein